VIGFIVFLLVAGAGFEPATRVMSLKFLLYMCSNHKSSPDVNWDNPLIPCNLYIASC